MKKLVAITITATGFILLKIYGSEWNQQSSTGLIFIAIGVVNLF